MPVAAGGLANIFMTRVCTGFKDEIGRLTDANRALKNLRDGRAQGAAVLVM